MLNISFYIISDQFELPDTFLDFSNSSIFRNRQETRFYAERTNFRGVSSNMELFGEYS